MMVKMKLEQQEREAKITETRMRLENDTQIINDVKEANELCKLLNRKIKFKQCIVQIFGNQNSEFDNFSESEDSYDEIKESEVKEELQIRVQNYDKK